MYPTLMARRRSVTAVFVCAVIDFGITSGVADPLGAA